MFISKYILEKCIVCLSLFFYDISILLYLFYPGIQERKKSKGKEKKNEISFSNSSVLSVIKWMLDVV